MYLNIFVSLKNISVIKYKLLVQNEISLLAKNKKKILKL